MYVEKRKIGNNEYLYLKTSEREGNKVRSKNIAYLGKSSMNKKEMDEKISRIIENKDINYEFLTKEQINKLEEIKKDFNKKIKTLPKQLIEDMFKDFKVFYIYNTNSIEGNTISLKETGLLLNDNLTPQGKDLREIYDHINGRNTFDYILEERPEIKEQTILSIHSRLLDKIDKRAGAIRTHNVRVLGATFNTSDYRYVKTDLNLLLNWYKQNKKILHPLILSALFHEKFERIHPFYDGNGRTGRMLVNLILIKNNYPPITIKNKDRHQYYDVLDKAHKADIDKNTSEYYKDIVEFFYNQQIKTYEEIFSRWG